jgi:hypothetical protein
MTPSKVPVVNKPEYTIWLENYKNIATFIHADVYKYNKTVRQEFGRDLNLLVDLHSFPLYVLTNKNNTKLKKFMSIYGLVLDHKPLCDDGIEREVYRLDRSK